MSQDSINEFAVKIAEKFPNAGLIMGLIGALVVIGQMLVPLTPTTKDDDLLIKLWSIPVLGQILHAFVYLAPIQKKPTPVLEPEVKAEVKKA